MGSDIDKLFQDKLARHETAPTRQAWDQVKTELGGKGKPIIWLRIAASVVLLAVSAFLIFRSVRVPIESSVFVTLNQPTPLENFQWNLPEIEPKIEETKEENLTSIQPKLVVKETFSITEETQETTESIADLQTMPETPMVIETKFKEAVAVLETGSPTNNQVEALPKFRVQITYRASEFLVKSPKQKTKIGWLWAKSQQVNPGEMLVSMRQKKNDFFNGKKN